MKYTKILVTIGLLVLIAVITTILVIVAKQSTNPLDADSNPASESNKSVESNTTISENVTSKTEPAESSDDSDESKTPTDTPSNTPSDTSKPAESKPNEESNLEPVDASYYKDACFIGDSRSEGFMMYAGPAEASYYVNKGLTVSGFFNTEFLKDGDKKVTVADALKNKQFGKVYIMLGINELGWAYSNVFYDRYCEIIDYIKEVQPDAKIFVQSIFPVSATKSAKDAHVNNKRIKEYNALIRKMCAEKNVIYLDVGQALQDENGNLPEDAAYDGVHLKKPYCEKWRAFLDTHTNVEAASESTAG
ncbi:MAG TPA: GDSL-type esterase/lipase family protein [Bacillota bacterium]|nr:GDSL-type esterase/lipase family protein [Bacillota bacterium]